MPAIFFFQPTGLILIHGGEDERWLRQGTKTKYVIVVRQQEEQQEETIL
jgi:hypothetical protein